jgi:hypothetical protein
MVSSVRAVRRFCSNALRNAILRNTGQSLS